MARAILILLTVCLTQGCFVFDELDKGEALMEAHRAKPAAEVGKPAPIARAAEPEPGLVRLEDRPGLRAGWVMGPRYHSRYLHLLHPPRCSIFGGVCRRMTFQFAEK